MYGLTKLSMPDVSHEEKIKVSAKQAKYLKSASKYVSLLFLAISTTFGTFIGFALVMFVYQAINIGDNEQLEVISLRTILIMTPIDCTVNIMCLYLQSSFANETYDKYCGCCGKCWNRCLRQKTEEAMKRKFAASIAMSTGRDQSHQTVATTTEDHTVHSKSRTGYDGGMDSDIDDKQDQV